MSAMPPPPATEMDLGAGGAGGGNESGLVGGIFSKKDHDSIRVKFSDVDWATIVRAGSVTQSEVCMSERFDGPLSVSLWCGQT